MEKSMRKILSTQHLFICRFFVFLLILGSLMPIHSVMASAAGWALKFDGEDDYVALGWTDSVMGSSWISTKSFSMWLLPMGAAQDCKKEPTQPFDVAFCDQILVNYPHFFGIARGIIDGQDRIWLWNHSTGDQRIGIQYTTGEWIHIAFVHANGVLKAYRNGNLVGQIASGATDTNGTITKLVLGGFLKTDQSSAFKGIIDEVRLYSTELTHEDIQSSLRQELVGDETGLMAYYKMSDGSGVNLTDDSIYTNNGVIHDGDPYMIGNGTYAEWVASSAWDSPIANDQIVSLDEDSSLAITLTGFPVAEDGTLEFFLVSGPSHGQLTGSIPNYTYNPDPNYNGADSLTFYVKEGALTSTVATVFIDVLPVNDAPSAYTESYSVDQNAVLNVAAPGVLENDVDIDGDLLTVSLPSIVPPAHGDLLLNEDGSFTYTPDAFFYGNDQFKYKASDGELLSAETTVNISVNQVTYNLYLPFLVK
jgi:hypothetical protein